MFGSRWPTLDCPRVFGRAANTLSAPALGETAAAVKGARHVELPGAGHACCIEDPEAFDRAVIDFLGQNGLWTGTTIAPPRQL